MSTYCVGNTTLVRLRQGGPIENDYADLEINLTVTYQQ